MTKPSAADPQTVLLVSPYWREQHRWMVSSVKLAELWQRKGYKVVVVCMGEKTETLTPSPTLTIHTVKDFFFADPWNYGIARGFTKTVKTVAHEVQPSVVVINKVLFWSSISIFALKRMGYRVILLTDALVGITWWPRGLIARIGAFFYAHTLGRMILKKADRIVFFHPQPSQVLKKLGIEEKSIVIPTGIDDTAMPAHTAQDDNRLVVTYVGRLESVKGVDDLLETSKHLLMEFQTMELRIVGWYRDGHPLVKEFTRPRIRFLGLRSDIPAILSETDIFVLPSHSEGLSNALMEAMACGCACVATNVGGNAYLIQNGISGLLFPAGDTACLSHHLHTLLRDAHMRRTLGDAARERIRSTFSWNIIGDKYVELFRSVKSQ